jgi:hypothetical protein
MASGGIMQTPTRLSAEVLGRSNVVLINAANCGGKFLRVAEAPQVPCLRRWLGNRLHVSWSHSFGLYHKITLEISAGHSLAGPVPSIPEDTRVKTTFF